MKKYRNESGQLHREDGPAVENNFIKLWYINGDKHSEDGPAVEYSDGYQNWYLNGIKYSEEEYNQELIKLKLKRLVKL